MSRLFDVKRGLETGLLIDISNSAESYGFSFPVYLSSFIWNEYIEILNNKKEIEANLTVLLTALREKKSQVHSETVRFKAEFFNCRDVLNCKAVTGPDEDNNPVILILLP